MTTCFSHSQRCSVNSLMSFATPTCRHLQPTQYVTLMEKIPPLKLTKSRLGGSHPPAPSLCHCLHANSSPNNSHTNAICNKVCRTSQNMRIKQLLIIKTF